MTPLYLCAVEPGAWLKGPTHPTFTIGKAEGVGVVSHLGDKMQTWRPHTSVFTTQGHLGKLRGPYSRWADSHLGENRS